MLVMSKTKIGFVGAGMMGQCAHLRNYAILPNCEVTALAELRPELAKRVASKYHIPRVYNDYREMLNSEKLDGIVAVQQFSNHGFIVPELLKARIPMFIEKPLASSVEAGKKILHAVRESGTWIMVGYHKRSDPAAVYAKQEVERFRLSKELGEMTYARITIPKGDWISGGFDDVIMTDEPISLQGSDPRPMDMDDQTFRVYLDFVNYYIHQVNLLRYLLGEPYTVEYGDAKMKLLVAKSESGVTATIEMKPYSTTLGWQESALVCFEHGWIRLDQPAPLVRGRPGAVTIFRDVDDYPKSLTPVLPPIDAMHKQAMNFIGAITGDNEPPCEAAEGLEDLIVAREYLKLVNDNQD